MKKNTEQTGNRSKGYIVVSVLAFSAVFALLMSSLLGFVFIQNKSVRTKESEIKAFQIAEAGLNYYKWFLSHFPNDFTNGTGEEGPYEEEYSDPETGIVGSFSLEVEGNEQCGTATSISIESTGWTADDPTVTRTLFGRYARPSVAEFAYIINSNVWAGSDREIRGRYHSNGGIRMDGTNDSLVTSAQETWLCTSSFGCSGTEEQPGVFGDGPGFDLWEFPVPQTDFVGITLDLIEMEDLARDDGIYFSPVGGQSNKHGYHLIFNGDGTFDAYRVNDTEWVWGYNSVVGEYERDYHIIEDESFLQTYTIPEDCALIFVEDRLWIEGEVSGKVTVAAAKVQQPNEDVDIVLNGDITYANADGSDGLTVVAENSVLIPLLSPNEMTLQGIFIAQNGNFGRNYYTTSGDNDVPSQYNSYVLRDTLDIHGSIVSNGRVGTKWTCSGTYCSGYDERVNAYDRFLSTDPPPLTPTVSDQYIFVEWSDED